MFELVCMIKNLVSESWELCDLVRIPSSTNIAPYALANNVISGDGGFKELSMPPAFISPILDAKKLAWNLVFTLGFYLFCSYNIWFMTTK